MSANIHPPLTNVQAELLKLFAAEIPEEHLTELKSVIANYLVEKARNKADKIWDEKGYNNDTLEKLLNGE
jgi:hypothetical protein